MILLIFFNHLICSSSQQKEVGFIYNGIGQAQADLHLQWLWPRRSKWVMLSSSSHSILIHMWKNISFWTHFVVSASIDFTQANPTQYLGLFKISTNGSPSSQLLAIELHNVQSAEFDDIDKNHIGIDINSLKSIESASASYFSNTKGKNQSTRLLSGQPLQVWVDYERALLNVTVAPLRIQKPNHPLLSRSINLTDIFPNQKLYFGFSAATGSLVRYQYISGWSFSRSRVLLQRLDYSKLPQIPHTITYSDGK